MRRPAVSEWSFPNAATPEGSAPYYCVRFSPPAARDTLAAAFAWRAELEHIVRKANDPGAARLKLDWWRDELRGVRQGRLHHPLSRALPPLLACTDGLTLMLRMLDGAENDIRMIQPQDRDGFYTQCTLIGGSLCELLANAAATDGMGSDRACLLGAYHEAVTRIGTLSVYLRRGYCPLPRRTDDGANLSVAALQRKSGRTNLNAVVAPLLQDPSQQVKWMLAADAHGARISPAHRLAAQALVLNVKMKRNNYTLLDEPYSLTPIRRLWAAWRLR